ncbi:MAG: FAD-binding domain-containing protein [Cyanobacteriota bacterium]
MSSWPGGRRAAEQRLAAIDPARYGASRNHLDGAVTGLSPYIRHGVLTLAEVRDAVFTRLARLETASQRRRVGERLIAELGWRDYWQRLGRQLGEGIWHDREPLRTGHPAAAYAPELPIDIATATTGLACMDAFAGELQQTGWLHNHARMWLASYVVHWRRVRWQAGARWFLAHLLDGDPASNNLSWQWVASSFSQKPYIFNRGNLERYGAGRHCDRCPLNRRGCPFEASYEQLQGRLFRPLPAEAPAVQPGGPSPGSGPAPTATTTPTRPLLWVHAEALGPTNPALRAHPGARAVFVASGDPPGTGGGVPLAEGRRRFLRECLTELPVAVLEGDEVPVLRQAAAAAGADGIVTSRAVDPRIEAISRELAQTLPVQVLDPEAFVDLPEGGPGSPDLRRFSRYWRRAEPLVWSQAGG